MNPLTWTEPSKDDPRECTLTVLRNGRVSQRLTDTTPSDIAAALNAARAEVVCEVWNSLSATLRVGGIRLLQEDLAAALKRAEEAEAERDESVGMRSEMRDELDQARLDASHANGRVRKLSDQLAAAERDRDEMRAQLGQLQPTLVEFEAMRQDRDHFQAELAALRDERRFALVCAALTGSAMADDRDHDHTARFAVLDADATLALLTTPVQPATPALAPDDAAELEAYRALFEWTRKSEHRWVAATEAEWLSRDVIIGAAHDDVVEDAQTPQALAAKLGAK